MDNSTLYTLFMPPDGCFGDFGLLCGYTATRDVLDRIKRSFSGEVARPALAAFIHPTDHAITDVPGLAWMQMRLAQKGYDLLHAKVAILGFRKEKGEGYVIRLVVSTGNWTQDPLTDSIDLFWRIDLDVQAPAPQEIADVQAAWAMFNWLRARSDTGLIEQFYDGNRPDDLLRQALEGLPASDLQPRFIDSRKTGLFDQVVTRLKMGKMGNRLILGSGYFEAAGDGRKGLIEEFRQDLVENGALIKKNAALDLFLNPDACQGLVAQAEALQSLGWQLRRPYSVLQGEHGRLHAKFAMLSYGAEHITGRVYIGSGNLSVKGFKNAVQKGGNLEAGVVVDLPKGLNWPTRRSSRKGLALLLPVQFSETVEITKLAAGEDFERPPAPESLPSVSWFVWEKGRLSAPEALEVAIEGPHGEALTTPCDWPSPAPAFVTLRDSGWRLPVLAQGVLVAPALRVKTMEDVLASLAHFPDPPEQDDPENDPDPEPKARGFETSDDAFDQGPETYAIRRMMMLLVRFGAAQRAAHPHDWQRWCRELRQNLCAIGPAEDGMIAFFRRAQANPLPALLEEGMRPKGVSVQALQAALADVAKSWGLSEFQSLWAGEAAA